MNGQSISDSASFHTGASPLRVIDLGRMAYAPAFAEQRRVNQAVIEGDEPDTLLLVEHEPVITVSHRKEAGQHLLASRDRLAQLGIDVQVTDRGGDVTYHGPGQLVAYPILRLGPLGLNLSRYMRMLEKVMMDTLEVFGVRGVREDGATGVWVQPAQPSKFSKPIKVCAMGVRVRRNVTMHGLALNVDPDLSHFQTIVPCGLHGRDVTSLAQLLGERAPTMDLVKQTLVAQMQAAVAARWNTRDTECA